MSNDGGRSARAPDEIMTAVLIEDDHNDGRSTFLKLGARRHLVISIVMVAALLDIGEDGMVKCARIAVGAASAVGRRLRGLEARLVGQTVGRAMNDIVSPDDFAELSPIDDLRATAEYRREAAVELVRRALVQLADARHG